MLRRRAAAARTARPAGFGRGFDGGLFERSGRDGGRFAAAAGQSGSLLGGPFGRGDLAPGNGGGEDERGDATGAGGTEAIDEGFEGGGVGDIDLDEVRRLAGGAVDFGDGGI